MKDSPVDSSDLDPFLDGNDALTGGHEAREWLRRVWAYKWLILLIVGVGLGGTWVYVQQLVPRYTATAVLMIEPPELNIIELQDVVEGLDTHPQTLRSEVIVLKSRELAAKAVERLDLFDDPRPLQARRPVSLFHHLNPLTYIPSEWTGSVRDFLREAKASIMGEAANADGSGNNGVAQGGLPELDAGEEENRRRAAIVNRFLSGLLVLREEFTRVVRISFTFENPKLAAEAANALADTYVQNTLDVKYAGTREAADWLSRQLESLSERVQESEAAVERVRQGEALVEGRSSQVVSDQISELNRQLLAAEAETAKQRARLRQVEQLMSQSNGTEAGSSLLGSPMVQTLRLEQFRLEREEADLALELGDKHPKMINVRAEILEVQSKLQKEFERIVSAARNELAVAQAQEASIRQNLNAITNQVGDLNEAELRLRALEREAAANRSLYESFLTRYKEASAQEEVQQPDARVISYALVPGSPSYPQAQKYLTTAAVLSFGIAFVLVFLLERMDKGYRTTRQLQQVTGLPVIGVLPAVNLSREGVAKPEDLITKGSHSRFTESINILYSNLKWPRQGEPLKTILIGSAMPKEGKTSTAIALARRAAVLGDEVLLIDGDFRQPNATRHLGLNSRPGLAEVVAGENTLEETLQRDEPSGAWFLAGGRLKEDPVALIGSEAFRQAIERLTERFDFIIFDTSPVLAVAEPQILSRVAGQCVMLVRWGKTARQVSLTAVKQLQDFGANVSGTVLTQVDLKQQSYYGYGEYGYYSAKMKDYYAGSGT